MNIEEAVAAIDRAFARAERPEHFTNFTHCCECADEDIRFSQLTPEALAAERFPETVGIAFLTREAFHYFMPALARRMVRGGQEYAVGDILFHIENRLDTFSVEQLAAIRDLLYVVYEQLQVEIHESAFDYEMVWRVLNDLDSRSAESPSFDTGSSD